MRILSNSLFKCIVIYRYMWYDYTKGWYYSMRVTSSKSKNSESFYINYAYIDKNGKSTSTTYKKLGTLAELSKQLNTDRDGVIAWAKEQARLATIEYQKENEVVNIPFVPNQQIDKDIQNSSTVVIYFYNLFIHNFALIISLEIFRIGQNLNLI